MAVPFPVGNVKIVSQISTFVLNTQPMYLDTQIKCFFSGDCSVDCWMEMCDVFASKVIQVHPNVNVRFHVSFLLSLSPAVLTFFIYKRIIVTTKNNAMS